MKFLLWYVIPYILFLCCLVLLINYDVAVLVIYVVPLHIMFEVGWWDNNDIYEW
jgi:hypothetical protein